MAGNRRLFRRATGQAMGKVRMLNRIRNNARVVAFARNNPRLLSLAQRNKRLYDLARGQVWDGPLSGANPLEHYFRTNPGRLISKWHHYFGVYDRHLSAYRGKPVTVVEFGVFHGGSVQMWKHYFGASARIVGVDINPACATLAEAQIEIVIGDQGDRDFLRNLADQVGRIDVLIEDGGHTMEQQISTFEVLWPSIVEGGVFIIEDLHTSYWDSYGGGVKRPGTFIEYAKDLIDQIHAWHSHEPDTLAVDDYTTTIRGMAVYDSVIVFEKGSVERPRVSRTGTPSFPDDATGN